MSDKWVSLAEARKLTGMDSGHINYYVRNGRIRRQEGSGPRNHRYNVTDLLRVKEEWTPRDKKNEEEQEAAIIDWVRYTDIPAGLKLAQMLYGEEVDLADIARYQAWRKYNPCISMGAFSQDRSECYAALMLIPLEEQTILDICSDRRTESSINTEDVQLYDRLGNYTLLATSALCLPDRPHLLYRVITHMMDFFVEMYPDRYITRIYAQAVSETGDKLVQMTYMAPRYDLAPDVYMLDMARPSMSKIIKQFQARLDEKADRPADLRKRG